MSVATHPITAAEVQKISAIASRLQSEHDGEVANAGRLLVRTLARHGLRVGEVLELALRPRPIMGADWRPEPSAPRGRHHALVNEALAGHLNDWERSFVADLQHRRTLTPRQTEVLTGIVNKVRRQSRPGGAA